MFDISIGTDPEVFVTDKDGAYVSGHNLIPGTKRIPHPVNLGAIQVDGVALEFNTEPAFTEDQFIENIEAVMLQMETEYKKVRDDVTITITPTAVFTKDYFDTLPPEAVELGCTPDYNAYTEEENEPPHTDEPFRTGSGHIHIGWGSGFRAHSDRHFSTCVGLVKELDCVLYPASLLWDADSKRRELYGKIGAFRPKSYGVEYRPLSNAYLRSKDIQRYVFRTAMHVTHQHLNEGVVMADDIVCVEVVEKIQSGETITPDEIKGYLGYLQDNYGVPFYD